MAEFYPVNITLKTWDDVLHDLIVEAQRRGLIDPSIDPYEVVGNQKYVDNLLILDYAVFSKAISDVYQAIGEVYNSMRLWTATGGDLDNIGQLFIPRYPPQRAVGVLRVGWDEALPEPITIPMGTRFTSEHRDLIFTARSDVMVPAGARTAEISIIGDDTGAQYNVPAGYITNCIDYYTFDDIYNPDATYGGYDGESDDSYRERLMNWKQILNRGTIGAYRDLLEGLKEVRGYHIEPWWDGAGTVLITIDPPVDEIIEDVDALIQGVRAADERVVVEAVKPVDIDLTIKVQVDPEYPEHVDPAALIKRIEDLMEVYVDGGELPDGKYWEGLRIGDDFVPFRAAAFLSRYVPEASNLQFKYPSDRVVIKADERVTTDRVIVEVE